MITLTKTEVHISVYELIDMLNNYFEFCGSDKKIGTDETSMNKLWHYLYDNDLEEVCLAGFDFTNLGYPHSKEDIEADFDNQDEVIIVAAFDLFCRTSGNLPQYEQMLKNCDDVIIRIST